MPPQAADSTSYPHDAALRRGGRGIARARPIRVPAPAGGAQRVSRLGAAMEPDPSMLPDGYDRLVDESADIDRLCSSSDWVLPAAATWVGDGLVVAAEP